MSQLTNTSIDRATPSEKMSGWMKEFVESYRLHHGSLTEEERRFVYNLDDFSAPCQIDLFWFQYPDAQYIIVTHFDDRLDLEVTVNGPFPTYEAVDKLEGVLSESRWKRPIAEGESASFFPGDS